MENNTMQKVTSKSTKSEIYRAYQALVTEHNALKERASARSVSQNSTAALNSVEEVIAALEQIKHCSGNAIGGLSALLMGEVDKMEQVQQQITTEQEAIAALYGIDVVDDQTLEGLLREYVGLQEMYTEQVATLKNEHGDVFDTKKADWEQEVQDNTLRIRKREQARELTENREQEEYEHQAKQEKILDQEEYEHLERTLIDELSAKRDQTCQQHDAAERTLQEDEQEWQELQETVGSHQVALNNAVKRGSAEGQAIAKRQIAAKANLRIAEIDQGYKTFELELSMKRDKITAQDQVIERLREQLANVSEQSQSIALSAIEGSEKDQNMEALRELAMEQAKNQKSSK